MKSFGHLRASGLDLRDSRPFSAVVTVVNIKPRHRQKCSKGKTQFISSQTTAEAKRIVDWGQRETGSSSFDVTHLIHSPIQDRGQQWPVDYCHENFLSLDIINYRPFLVSSVHLV